MVLCSALSSMRVMQSMAEWVPAVRPEEMAKLAFLRMLEAERSLGPVLRSRSVTDPRPEASKPVAMPRVSSDHTRTSARERMEPSPPANKLVIECR